MSQLTLKADAYTNRDRICREYILRLWDRCPTHAKGFTYAEAVHADTDQASDETNCMAPCLRIWMQPA